MNTYLKTPELPAFNGSNLLNDTTNNKNGSVIGVIENITIKGLIKLG